MKWTSAARLGKVSSQQMGPELWSPRGTQVRWGESHSSTWQRVARPADWAEALAVSCVGVAAPWTWGRRGLGLLHFDLPSGDEVPQERQLGSPGGTGSWRRERVNRTRASKVRVVSSRMGTRLLGVGGPQSYPFNDPCSPTLPRHRTFNNIYFWESVAFRESFHCFFDAFFGCLEACGISIPWLGIELGPL